jgi:hypothetical protein
MRDGTQLYRELVDNSVRYAQVGIGAAGLG